MFERLLEQVLRRTIRKGRLDLTYADGRHVAFGTPEPGFPEIAIRFTDGRVPRQIVSDPRLGAGAMAPLSA